MGNPNPNTPKTPKILLPSLSNCHSCDLQTPTPLHTLESEWRIVLLCDHCVRLVNSAAKCSYCFSDCSKDERIRSLDCRQCSHRIHFNCIPIEQRFISLSNLNLDSFVCVDCCALPRFGDVNHPRSVLASVEIDPVVKDEELALQLHLAINGSQRISRSGSMGSDWFAKTKKVKKSDFSSINGEKIGSSAKDEGLTQEEEPKKEIGMAVNSSKDNKNPAVWITYQRGNKSRVTGFREKPSEKEGPKKEIGVALNSSEDNKNLAVWITYQRANKSRGTEFREKPSEMKQSMNGGENLVELEQKTICDPPEWYAKKYKRKSRLREALNGESR